MFFYCIKKALMAYLTDCLANIDKLSVRAFVAVNCSLNSFYKLIHGICSTVDFFLVL